MRSHRLNPVVIGVLIVCTLSAVLCDVSVDARPLDVETSDNSTDTTSPTPSPTPESTIPAIPDGSDETPAPLSQAYLECFDNMEAKVVRVSNGTATCDDFAAVHTAMMQASCNAYKRESKLSVETFCRRMTEEARAVRCAFDEDSCVAKSGTSGDGIDSNSGSGAPHWGRQLAAPSLVAVAVLAMCA